MKDNVLIKYSNSEEYKTSFDGSISSIELNGQKLTEIHELAKKCDKLSKIFIFSSTLCLCGFSIIIFLFLTTIPDIEEVAKAFDQVEDSNSRLRYMIDVRPAWKALPFQEYNQTIEK